MKVCVDCYRVNKDNAEECVGCGFTNFQPILPIEEPEPACYERLEDYKEEDNV